MVKYGYDAALNHTSMTDPENGVTQYTYDMLNRLINIQDFQSHNFGLSYDQLSGRPQLTCPNGVNTNYLYNGIGYGSNVIEEVDSVGNVLARYTQSPAVDQPLAEVRSGTTTYYQQDALSSVTSLSSPAGALANTYTFDSFGKLTASTGTLTNPFQYSGREFDAESGLFYNRHRFYDPSLGRFISEDPSGFAGGLNFYGYVKNNPVLWIDPSGLVRCTYNISTHQLHCLSDDLTQSFDTDRARSGRGLCRNDRACENRSNQGPIPEGEYYMGQTGDTPNRHKVPRIPLTAFDGSLAFDLGRGGFQVHQGNDSSSSGCIVLDPAEYQRFLSFYARDNSGVMGVR